MLSGNQPFAILLCNFTNSTNPIPFTKQDVEKAFIARNTRSVNDYFIDNSNGNISLDGSKVFQWTTIPSTKENFIDKYRGVTNARFKIVQEAKTYFSINYNSYIGVIVFFSDEVGDAWTAGNVIIFEPNIATSFYICHEIGHIFGKGLSTNYGVDHSFDFSGRKLETWSKPGEYWNQTDIMSAGNVWDFKDQHNCFDGYGPNFCAIFKELWGWLDSSKIISLNPPLTNQKYYCTSLKLNSRSHPELLGLQYVKLSFEIENDIYIEYATQEGWDSGLPNNGLLINEKIGNTPFIKVNNLNQPDDYFWTTGMVFEKDFTYKLPRWRRRYAKKVFIQIVKIDQANKCIYIDITNQPKYYPFEGNRIEIVAIRKYRSTANGGFDYIGEVGVMDNNGQLQSIYRSDVANWILTGRNSFFVKGMNNVETNVIVQQGYIISTEPDNIEGNNLLSLPEF